MNLDEVGVRSSHEDVTTGQTVEQTVWAAGTGEICCCTSPLETLASAKVLGTLGNGGAATRG